MSLLTWWFPGSQELHSRGWWDSLNPSGWVKGQGELGEALGALETSSGGIRRPGLLVLRKAGTGVAVATLSRQEEEGMLCLAHGDSGGVTRAELGTGTPALSPHCCHRGETHTEH